MLLWWCSQVCTACISLPAANTCPKAVILAAYRLWLDHPATSEALLISMHPDGSQPLCLASHRSLLLRPTGSTGYCIRDTIQPGRCSRHFPAASIQAAGCCTGNNHWMGLDGALSMIITGKCCAGGGMPEPHSACDSASLWFDSYLIYLSEREKWGRRVCEGGQRSTRARQWDTALSPAGSLAPRGDTGLMAHVSFCLFKAIRSLAAGQIWADGEPYIISVSGEM